MKEINLRKLMLLGIVVLWGCILALPARAQVNVRVRIQLPVLEFSSPPRLVVLPETNVYVVPDMDEDIFFSDGWWWRSYQGHWYRSSRYDQGWVAYSSVPVFYRQVPSDWRSEYRDHNWRGQPWNYEHLRHDEVQNNWSGWKKDKHWERNNTWGVEGLNRQPPQPRYNNPQPRAPQPRYTAPQPRSTPPGHQGNQGNRGKGNGNNGKGKGNNQHGGHR
jgi:hypothetical protein